MEQYWREIVMTLGGLWIGALHWIGKRELRRKDEDITRLFERLDKRDDEARSDRKAIHAKLDKTITSVGHVAERVSRIEGQLSGQRQDRAG